MPVTMSATGSTLASNQAVVDVNGNAVFLVTPTSGGIKTLIATAANRSASSTFTISGDTLSLTAVPLGITQGQTVTLRGRALRGNGAPIANAAITWQINGVAFSDASTQYVTTDAQGNFERIIRADGFGSLVASVTVGSIQSSPVTVTVAQPVDVDTSSLLLRLRGKTYQRAKPPRR